MMDASKYRVGYYPVGKEYNKWVEKDHVEKPPVWCSVDMRDGNQRLVIPITLEKKMEYYKVLIRKAFGACKGAIADKDVVNTSLSAARMLRFSFDISREADTTETTVAAYLDAGYRTADIMSKGMTLVGYKQCGDLIVNFLEKE